MLVPRKNNYDLFDGLFDDSIFRGFDNNIMKTDIQEKEKEYILNVDLPGVLKENIKMSIEDGYLTITANSEVNHDEHDKKGKYVKRERYYGESSRSFYVGEGIAEEDIKATYKDGVLNVIIPKKEEKKKETKYIAIE